jgi:hypothetical protein
MLDAYFLQGIFLYGCQAIIDSNESAENKAICTCHAKPDIIRSRTPRIAAETPNQIKAAPVAKISIAI